ncbi:MAG: hypothetical protein V4467_04255 [Patescibacteria group bacterium]
MTTDENKIFIELSELLKRAVNLIELRIEQIENKHPESTTSKAEKEADACIRTFYVRSLKPYRDTILFLSEEIVRENEKYHFFLVPHARKLFDIYVRFLHLLENCASENQRGLACIAYQLLAYKGLRNESVYNELLSINKNLLDEEKRTFPNFIDFDYLWYLRTSGLAFKTTRDLFKVDIINKYSNPPIKIFRGQNIVELYGSISELCHGNPYYHYDSPYTERFWVATISFMVTSYLINLTDTYILNKTLPRDFHDWLREVDKASRSMVAIWKTKRRTTL